MKKNKTHDIGKKGEKLACLFLENKGYKIIGRNVHLSHNEIDIIVSNNYYIVFVEVKTRSTDDDLYSYFGSPACAVDYNKKKRIVAAARAFIRENKKYALQPRFDVIEVYLHKESKELLKINHIENAFGA